MAGYYTNNNYIYAASFPQTQSQAALVVPMQQHQQNNVSENVYVDPRINVHGNSGDNLMPSMLPAYATDHGIQPGLNFNHLPYSSGMAPPIMTTLSSVSTMSVGLGVTAPGSFTFTSPTRLSYISSSQCQTNPYEHFSMSSPSTRRTFAPGLGVSWQHTVPIQMPWSDSSSTAVPPHFVGSVTYSSSDNASGRPCNIGEPVPSCSTPIRRPKRPALSTGCELPSKVYITEEKMAASMQELSISNHDSVDENMVPQEDVPSNNNAALTSTQTAIERSWQKFRELEDMLSEEHKVPETNDLSNTGFKVHVNTTVAGRLLSPNPLLPRTVLQNMKKPCLQVVLWKPPVDKLREVVSENLHNNRHKHGIGKEKSSVRSGDVGRTDNSVNSSTALNTPITSPGVLTNRNQSDIAKRSTMEFEDDDSAMEL